eukprot:scaffold1019_cov338-Pavlova_lutheri.AAC.28
MPCILGRSRFIRPPDRRLQIRLLRSFLAEPLEVSPASQRQPWRVFPSVGRRVGTCQLSS